MYFVCLLLMYCYANNGIVAKYKLVINFFKITFLLSRECFLEDL